MSAKYQIGNTVYIVESNNFVRECIILRNRGDLYVVGFHNGGAIQVKGYRIYQTKEEAEESIINHREVKKPKIGYRSPYDYVH